MMLKTYNILVMGQTGTGKSTWINSFANYFEYESLEDALSDDLIWLIPSTFQLSTTDEDGNFKMHTVTIGDHLCESIAESDTQVPQVYSFRHQSFILNFIDVPGIGDTRGIETDNINMKAILNTVGIFEELHGICILLKSSDTKLTTEYKFCLNEVLMHLHRKALDNVFFIITHSQGSNYLPGNSFTTLQAYLKELKSKKGIEITLTPKKLFCIDNEAFRFQCAYKQLPEFQSYDYSTYKKSWKQSRMATMKLLKEMKELKPHEVLQTLSINQARAIILSLIPSLATITAIIQTNATNFEQNFDEIISKLQHSLIITEYTIELEELSKPRTVCTATKCIGVEKDENGKFTTFYKQICHSSCHLTGVPIKSFPEPQLLNCAAMCGQGNCEKCGCHYTLHMHIDFNQKKVAKKSRLGSSCNSSSSGKIITKEDAKELVQKELKNLEHEQEVISDAMIQFSGYLKQNAIFEYNSAFEERMKMEIRNEEAAVKSGGDRVILEKLQNMLDEYIDRKEKLEVALAHATDEIIDPTQISELKNQLFELPIYGGKIKELYEKSTSANYKRNESHNFIERDINLSPF
uniref:G domain-containing protein n=1 Tax=Panagrolaimus superbus TaxID=310955 RepID=A0A914Y1A5_9BILA